MFSFSSSRFFSSEFLRGFVVAAARVAPAFGQSTSAAPTLRCGTEKCGSDEKAGVKEETLVDGGDVVVAALVGLISAAVVGGS